MTCKILIPRIGRFDYVTRNVVVIMYHILKRKKFNLPAIMLRIMQEAQSRAKPTLPYGMFLTLVFKILVFVWKENLLRASNIMRPTMKSH